LGTTATALLASLVTGKSDAVAVALVHFWFNVFGIFLFYPIPFTRKPIYGWARNLAFFSARWPPTAVLFIIFLFLVIPGVVLGLTYLYQGSTVAIVFAALITIIVAVIIAGFYFWYYKRGGQIKWLNFLERKAEEHRQKQAGKNQETAAATSTEV